MRPMSLVKGTVVALAAALVFASVSKADDWPRFRGPDGNGVSKEAGVPAELNPAKNLLWKVEAGEGTSCPVIVRDRLFLTAVQGDERVTRCFNARTGEALWTASIRRQREEVATPPAGPATPTAAADEANVYAFFPDAGLVCYSQDGREWWQVALGPFQSFHGVSASPVVAEGRVIVLVDQLEGSFLAAYECKTGKEAWKIARPDGRIGGYSTPSTRKTANGKTELVVSGPAEVAAYDPATGGVNWSVSGVTNVPICVPVVVRNRVFVCEPSFTDNPFKWESMREQDKDKNGKVSLAEAESSVPLNRLIRQIDEKHGNKDGELDAGELEKAFRSFVGGGGLAAIEIDESGAPPQARVKWTYRKAVPQVPSVLYDGGVLYFVNDGGILTSVDPGGGEVVKRERLGQGSQYYASPVAAGGRLYLIDTEGKIAVVEAEGDWKAAATSELGEKCYATPAIANGRVYVRGERNLFCFGAR